MCWLKASNLWWGGDLKRWERLLARALGAVKRVVASGYRAEYHVVYRLAKRMDELAGVRYARRLTVC